MAGNKRLPKQRELQQAGGQRSLRGGCEGGSPPAAHTPPKQLRATIRGHGALTPKGHPDRRQAGEALTPTSPGGLVADACARVSLCRLACPPDSRHTCAMSRRGCRAWATSLPTQGPARAAGEQRPSVAHNPARGPLSRVSGGSVHSRPVTEKTCQGSASVRGPPATRARLRTKEAASSLHRPPTLTADGRRPPPSKAVPSPDRLALPFFSLNWRHYLH